MQRLFYSLLSIILSGIIIVSCSNSSKVNNSKKDDAQLSGKGEAAGPPAIIYQTKADYYDKVTVTLSEDKSEIVSYPGIKDVFYKGELAYPTRLNDGFLLDNRGISATSAFLNITYDAYSKLDKTPSKEELHNMILDNDPFIVVYYCGSKYKYNDIVTELNSLIDEESFDGFTKLK